MYILATVPFLAVVPMAPLQPCQDAKLDTSVCGDDYSLCVGLSGQQWAFDCAAVPQYPTTIGDNPGGIAYYCQGSNYIATPQQYTLRELCPVLCGACTATPPSSPAGNTCSVCTHRLAGLGVNVDATATCFKKINEDKTECVPATQGGNCPNSWALCAGGGTTTAASTVSTTATATATCFDSLKTKKCTRKKNRGKCHKRRMLNKCRLTCNHCHA